MTQTPSFARWLRATWLGWLLGIPLVVGLALLGESVGVGGAQVLVGAGMGAGVGLLQARALRGVLPAPSRWLWATVAGLAAPFLVTDVANALGGELPYWLYVAVAVGGTLAGAAQSLLLRPHARGKLGWIVASALGWSLAGATAALAEPLSRSSSWSGIVGALAFLGVVALGGGLLGIATAAALVRTLQNA